MHRFFMDDRTDTTASTEVPFFPKPTPKKEDLEEFAQHSVKLAEVFARISTRCPWAKMAIIGNRDPHVVIDV